jgi:hypothetical protein
MRRREGTVRFHIAVLTIIGLIASVPARAVHFKDFEAEYRAVSTCDAEAARRAVNEILASGRWVKEPLLLLYVALGEYYLGRREEAAFWLLAGQLRVRRQLVFMTDGREYVLGGDVEYMSSMMMPTLESNSALAARVRDRIRQWDSSNLDLYRDWDAARLPENADHLRAVDKDFEAMLASIPVRKPPVTGATERERMWKYAREKTCDPKRELYAREASAAAKALAHEAVELVKVHPFIVEQLKAAPMNPKVGSYRGSSDTEIPYGITVRLDGASGYMTAEIAVESTVRDHHVTSSRLLLACLSALPEYSAKRRQGACEGDPDALVPPPDQIDLRRYGPAR